MHQHPAFLRVRYAAIIAQKTTSSTLRTHETSLHKLAHGREQSRMAIISVLDPVTVKFDHVIDRSRSPIKVQGWPRHKQAHTIDIIDMNGMQTNEMAIAVFRRCVNLNEFTAIT